MADHLENNIFFVEPYEDFEVPELISDTSFRLEPADIIIRPAEYLVIARQRE